MALLPFKNEVVPRMFLDFTMQDFFSNLVLLDKNYENVKQ